MIIISQLLSGTGLGETKEKSRHKSNNQLGTIRLLKHGREMTRQEVARALGISMPTALHCIEDLLGRGIIAECGENASTGGRRAKVFSLNPGYAFAVGIQITRRHLRFALTDLAGRVLKAHKLSLPYSDETDWYRQMGQELLNFIEGSSVDKDRIIGAGLSFPGIIDQKGQMILHSHVFDIVNVSLDRFYRFIPYPLIVANDANCACYAEQNEDMDSYFYLSLNESVGGALMLDHKLVTGAGWRAGEAGHMVLHPGGKQCYCGKKGCADAYLWTGVLTGQDEELDGFFARLEGRMTDQDTGEFEPGTGEDPLVIWENYLDDLAILVSNINMMLDMDIVLGGDVGARMEPYIERLSEITAGYDNFSRNVEYIHSCRCKDHIFLTGAALHALDYYDYRLIE